MKQINLVEGIPFFVDWSMDVEGVYSYTFYYENPIDGYWEEFLNVEETPLFLESYVGANKDQIMKEFLSVLPYILEDARVVRKTIDEFVEAAGRVLNRLGGSIDYAK